MTSDRIENKRPRLYHLGKSKNILRLKTTHGLLLTGSFRPLWLKAWTILRRMRVQFCRSISVSREYAAEGLLVLRRAYQFCGGLANRVDGSVHASTFEFRTGQKTQASFYISPVWKRSLMYPATRQPPGQLAADIRSERIRSLKNGIGLHIW